MGYPETRGTRPVLSSPHLLLSEPPPLWSLGAHRQKETQAAQVQVGGRLVSPGDPSLGVADRLEFRFACFTSSPFLPSAVAQPRRRRRLTRCATQLLLQDVVTSDVSFDEHHRNAWWGSQQQPNGQLTILHLFEISHHVIPYNSKRKRTISPPPPPPCRLLLHAMK